MFDSVGRGSYNTAHLAGHGCVLWGRDRANRVSYIAALIDNFIFQEGIRGQRIIVMRRSLFS